MLERQQRVRAARGALVAVTEVDLRANIRRRRDHLPATLACALRSTDSALRMRFHASCCRASSSADGNPSRGRPCFASAWISSRVKNTAT
ncbi:hypothetical protein ACFPRL_31740 [Pseudoclavibacter helvolus]